ncbi:DUF389 domain-containing protein [Paenarthrobacter sp. DKR-5]|uniref:DUF389 domain-containing protein n=1 Tax=Paenarthrobacter sp. DKR-5 TaxID=2835535 RepID=UPI001BDC17EC|nr:DUF389 domain-containing protein [Paenarthrobacter sp. DKR-5]MBT1001015.1 DUF389 domain-containing protein [Paenarthrobacter sp. DKR-5]
MIVEVRVSVAAGYTEDLLAVVAEQVGVAGVAVHRGASVVPQGDVLLVHVARESVEALMEQLHALEIPRHGSVTVSTPELVLSDRAEQAEEAAPGEGADAVIWDEVKTSTGEDARLSWSYLAFLVIATQLAAIGIVTESTITIVGAMVVGPEFGPLAGLAVALTGRKWPLARQSALALAVGFPLAMAVTAVCCAASVPLGLVDTGFLEQGASATDFIYHPGPFSLIVALLAGAAGMLSLIARKSSALVGVFISVTTVPAAGFVAVALVLGQPDKALGSAVQLVVNLVGIVLAAVLVLWFYRIVTRAKATRAGTRPTRPSRKQK